ncbi:exonuclease domain-containing protein [Corynebacterium silvaticum]|uniref:Exonuclease domain-containing protein n=1 Tax=Corynebacterium silvaticum TaxID=2320431 RepID=A0A7Y4LFU6_9CORY|nr:exonuclease domain-containing protein [Corynebacterium silvaticum]ARU46440.1 exonuclease domain-containing protein [Corynebacterium silvaticum]MBH5299583.1 DNA polymerase III subunit epsilon [Corynebacterium silvaticum]NON69303.1 DNA polymerase III subunit epsilon [Corynebacterium silvaticum]TRM17923.1 DNA polymerase III subunit epsilon [Corynebacterium silvaticum]UWG99663.1 DNA polymerase III subunit epsilon [Corynebacterium silvaticum]
MADAIHAHGATVLVDRDQVAITPSLLHTALATEPKIISLASIDSVSTLKLSDGYDCGIVTINCDSHTVRLEFSPNRADEQQAFISAATTALNGQAPAHRAIPGLDFAAVDVETANDDWGSICQIGVVTVKDGVITDKREWLCQPPTPINHFAPANIAIHGIRPDDVATAQPFSECFAEMLSFTGDLPLAAHNAQFDMTAFFRAAQADNVALPTVSFGCSLALSRAADLGTPNHKLPTVAKHLNVDLTNHHNATADAAACAGIIIKLAQKADVKGSFVDVCAALGFTQGQLSAQRVYPVLKKKPSASLVESAATSATQPPIGKTHAATKTAAPQKRKAQTPWAKAATPEVIPEPNPDADPHGRLYQQNVTLTGDFEPFDKGKLWDGIAEQGGTIGKNVTKKTTILVCGPWASITSKQKRAEELIAKGQNIQIWTAEDLFAQLGLDAPDEQPPF